VKTWRTRVITALALALLAYPITSCGGEDSTASPDYTLLGNPELVTITGYSGDVMEPFISRDGAYLFFNNNGGGATDKDLFYATYVTDTTFQFQSAIAAVNSVTVDGTPTMDDANTFYYVSLASYNPPTTYDSIFAGTWSGGTVTGASAVAGLAIALPGFINFDVEISPDGSTLYFNDGYFTGGGFPDAADIAIAVDSGSGFGRDPNSAAIMANVNTTDKLEYAPAISRDGLELFFTRLDPNTMAARIYRTSRATAAGAFGAPQLVRAIEGFVEGPALSPDEKSLYYHRLNTAANKFELYRVTRP
jgi:hypothetical protein